MYCGSELPCWFSHILCSTYYFQKVSFFCINSFQAIYVQNWVRRIYLLLLPRAPCVASATYPIFTELRIKRGCREMISFTQYIVYLFYDCNYILYRKSISRHLISWYTADHQNLQQHNPKYTRLVVCSRSILWI